MQIKTSPHMHNILQNLKICMIFYQKNQSFSALIGQKINTVMVISIFLVLQSFSMLKQD